GVALVLVLGKPVGILLATWLITRTRQANLARGLGWMDIGALGVLAGIGFPMSLLVVALALGKGQRHDEHDKNAVKYASMFAALVGSGLLWWRGKVHHRRGDVTPTPSG